MEPAVYNRAGMPDTNDRTSKLQAMLEKSPRDTFLLYALAMEHKKAQNVSEALSYLKRVVESDANYSAAWQQTAMLREQTGDIPGARQAYQNGIEAARRAGDAHAAEEMQGALSML